MHLKPYQWAILAGSLLALTQAVARLSGWNSVVGLLEAPSFLLCTGGILAGARPIQSRFQALRRNKDAARKDADFLRQRHTFQLWSVPAVTSVGSLCAVRFGYSPLFALLVLIGLALFIPLINRASGWNES